MKTEIDDSNSRILELMAINIELIQVTNAFSRYVRAIKEEEESDTSIFDILSRFDSISDRILWSEVNS